MAEHQESYGDSIRMASPDSLTNSEDDSEYTNDSVENHQRSASPRLSNSRGILSRLRESTSRLSFGDDARKHSCTSQDSEQGQRNSQDSSSTRPGKEAMQDMSDEEKQQEPRRSKSGWRPSLSLIRQESNGSNMNYYLQNDPNRLSGLPSNTSDIQEPANSSNLEKKHRRTKGGKNSKKKRRRAKKRRAEQLAAQQRQHQLYEQQLAQQARTIPGLTQVLEKKSRYPLSYDDFEAFLRSLHAVEYLNFWADVTAHEQLCRTFDVSERRQKREQQLEERAIARDRRRAAVATAMESGRLIPDPDLLLPGIGIGIGATGQVNGSDLYAASRSSLQLPLSDHLSFPQENRRYGIQNSSSVSLSHSPPSQSSSQFVANAYNRNLPGSSDQSPSEEASRPSLEEAHISEQDAAVAAVALRAQRNGLFPYVHSREDIRRGSIDAHRPKSAGGLAGLRYQQNNSSNGYIGGAMSSSYTMPNAYNMMMRGRGSVDAMVRSSSRNSRFRPDDYFNSSVRRTSSHYPQQLQAPQFTVQDEDGQHSDIDQGDQASQHSIGFLESGLNRRPSIGRFGGGVGPLQAPASIRRSGESAYTPSIYEGKALLAQSFRTISLEDLLESALRIYRKYLIQLRTASMAAEEEEAAFAAKDSYGSGGGGHTRKNIDNTIAPGWNGYAEEIITEWNEKWRDRKSRRLSTRKSALLKMKDGDRNEKSNTTGDTNHLSVDTQATSHTESIDGKSEIDLENQDPEDSNDDNSVPVSPISPRLKKKTGTGLSIFNPFLTRLMRMETTIVELPTLTINTTTVEEAAIIDDSAEEYDDDDEYEFDDSDDDDDDDEEYGTDNEVKDYDKDVDQVEGEDPLASKDVSSNKSAQGELAPESNIAGLEEIVVLERSLAVPSHLVVEAEPNHEAMLISTTTTQNFGSSGGDNSGGERFCSTEVNETDMRSSSSSLSSSWDRITKHDLKKQVMISTTPIATSPRSSPYQRARGLREVSRKTGDAARLASTAAQRVGGQLSALLRRSIRGTGSSSSTLGVIQITPGTSPITELPSFQFQIPEIVMNNQDDKNEKEFVHDSENKVDALGIRSPLSTSTYNSFVHQLQGEPINHKASSTVLSMAERRMQNTGKSSLQLPKLFLSPETSSTNPTATSSPPSSLAPSMNAPHISSSTSVAASAAASAFYLPLECRQRIHGQIQEQSRACAPHLFGPAKGFVTEVVLQDHFYPLFLEYVDSQNLGLLTRNHPNNIIKKNGMIWVGVIVWLIVLGIQLALVLLGKGGWKSPWVWIVGIVGGWSGSICLATGIEGFSPILGLMGKISNNNWTKLQPASRFKVKSPASSTTIATASARTQQKQHLQEPLTLDGQSAAVNTSVHTQRPRCSLFLDELGRPPLLKLSSAVDTSSKSLPTPSLVEDSSINNLFHQVPCANRRSYNSKDEKKDNLDKIRAKKVDNGPIFKELAWTSSFSEFPSSPLTPVPADSHTDIDSMQLSTTSPLSSLQADSGIPSSQIQPIGKFDTDCKEVNETPEQVSTLRAKPKPSPIATGLSCRTTSFSSMDNVIDRDPGSVTWGMPDMNDSRTTLQPMKSDSPVSAESAEVGGRDSGIALEAWDSDDNHKWQNTPKKEQFPSFDQLFQSQLDLIDPFRFTHEHEHEHSVQRLERRQRCRSMVYPTTHQSEIEDTSSKSDAESLPSNNNPIISTTFKPGCKTRAKRVSSMSIGSDFIKPKNLPLVSHDLPPLPPKSTTSTSVPRTSFFVAPSHQENTIDTNHSRFQRWTSNSSSSSLSSSSSATSATISLPRAVSPPLISVSTQSHGIPFSNMLDLATAKAENITGLYFAKQMNRKSASQFSLKETVQGTHTSNFENHKSNTNIPILSLGHHSQAAVAPIKIELDAPSPIIEFIPPKSERTTLEKQDIITEVSNIPCTKTTIESLTPPIHTALETDINSSLDTITHLTQTQAPSSSSKPTRGQHRRSQSASHFFHLSSLKHHSPAQFNLALCYEHGQGGVDKDLEKAIYFYQQAADQGHTKASYNIGCICYNQGEVTKAMAWFESAGKCCIRGLTTESSERSISTPRRQQQSLEFPLPKQTTLPHELEDILLGDRSSTSGPFAAYLPAILCLALLCRQGVQTRDGDVILKKDVEQSVELLRMLLQRASSRPHLRQDKDSLEPKQYSLQGSCQGRAFVGGGRSVDKARNRSRSSSRGGLNQLDQAHLSSPLSASCPSLPLGTLTAKGPMEASLDPSYCSYSHSRGKTKRPSTVEDEIDSEIHQNRDSIRVDPQETESTSSNNLPSSDAHGSDDHESWSLTLAEQLLKVWKPITTTDPTPTTADLSEVERRHKRILRHHLLYITNPTLSKNLYNLGVLYDLYLRDAAIAVKCYRSAYHQELPVGSVLEQPGFVTKINSAWNLGVLHVRLKEWKLAREWFLRAQKDIRVYESQQPIEKLDQTNLSSEAVMQIRENNSARIQTPKRSLVNVVPHNNPPLPTDSPGKKHVCKHGLMMHLGAISSKSIKVASTPEISHDERKIEPQRVRVVEDVAEDGIRTDRGKIAWVLRWVESHIE
ncbi:hypothetical protein BGZ46_003270 [Entomortierella lignicola]|nr:hypothetical protein BGZ46_003270 [Entomortierella lignicola]